MKARYFAVIALAGLTIGPATTATSQIREATTELAKKFDGSSWLFGRIGGADAKMNRASFAKAAPKVNVDVSKLPFVPGAYAPNAVYLTRTGSGSVVATQGSNVTLPTTDTKSGSGAVVAEAGASPMSAASVPSRGVVVAANLPSSLPNSVVSGSGDPVITSSVAPKTPDTAPNLANPIATNLPAALSPNLLAPVPEPSTWAMLILGFGLVGVTVRRRRTRLASFI